MNTHTLSKINCIAKRAQRHKLFSMNRISDHKCEPGKDRRKFMRTWLRIIVPCSSILQLDPSVAVIRGHCSINTVRCFHSVFTQLCGHSPHADVCEPALGEAQWAMGQIWMVAKIYATFHSTKISRSGTVAWERRWCLFRKILACGEKVCPQIKLVWWNGKHFAVSSGNSTSQNWTTRDISHHTPVKSLFNIQMFNSSVLDLHQLQLAQFYILTNCHFYLTSIAQ